MKGERPARLLLPPMAPRRAAARPGGRPTASPSASRYERVSSDELPARPAGAEADKERDRPSVSEPAAAALFEALRRHRLAVARAEGIAPFIVASDRTLRDIAVLRPRDLDELQLAYGIGRSKAERYGAGFLEVVRGSAITPSRQT